MKKTFFCIAFLVIAGCGGPEKLRSCGSGGARTGGAPGTGGRVSTGGAPATGGASSGGAPATGGMTATGGRGTGGAASGGSATGGMASGGSSTGGAASGGSSTGGSGGGAVGTILWRDSLQTGSNPWGFDELLVERPTEVEIVGSDARGANLSRVGDPAGGAGFAMRHLCTFDQAGCRSEIGVWSFQNSAFNTQAKSAQGVWVAVEMYFPTVVTAGGEDFPWLNIWDWHSTDNGGGNRWATSPGVMLAHDGSMRLRFEWGGPSYDVNGDPTPYSTLALPVGRWVDVEMHYVWSTSPVKIDIWIDGQAALSVTGVTKRSSHSAIETYSKWYGAQNDGARSWTPSPTTRYTRNVRIANARIWPQK